MCVVSLACLYFVEMHKSLVPQPFYQLKLEAAELANKAFKEIKEYRLSRRIPINKKHDPAETGLIGKKNSDITSDHGVLRSKQISVNPNLAAVIVQWLKDLSLKEGDVVAVGMTGSFPALDISTLAALKTLKLEPLVIVSVASSNWGANLPEFNVLDMLYHLHQRKILTFEPLAASIGASKDSGKSLTDKGVNSILYSIEKHKDELIKQPLVSESIDKRLDYYQEAAKGQAIKAYINIGGGVASIGKHHSKGGLSKEQKEAISSTSLHTGVNRELPVALANTNSVAVRFLKEGVPVINIKNVGNLALTYDLHPWKLGGGIGIGKIFFHQQYNAWLAFFSLLIIAIVCWIGKRQQVRRKQQEANEGLF
jgi:poly-gamma-glutamate system protein